MQAVYREGDAPNRLDAILFESFDDLRAARAAEDRRIVDFVDGLDEAASPGTIKYRRVSSPKNSSSNWRRRWRHWFNHQTHHRGQCARFITGLVAKRRSSIADFPAAIGKIRLPDITKLHRFACRVAVAGFAAPERMQQYCASGVMNAP